MTIAASTAEPVAHIASAAVLHAASATSTIIAAASAAATAASSPSPTPDAWLNGFATLVGALVGALAASGIAYKLQVRAEKKRERATKMLEAHQLTYCLAHQTNTILLAWRDHFSESVNVPIRFMLVPAMTPLDLDRYVADLSKMTLLLDQKEGRRILYELTIAQDSYRETLGMLNERSRVHRTQLQPAVEQAGIAGTDLTIPQIKWALGEMLVLSMVGMTDNCYSLLSKTFQKLSVVNHKARKYFVERFESDDFTQVSFPETHGIEAEQIAHYQLFKQPVEPAQ